jgi:hypothetical protein
MRVELIINVDEGRLKTLEMLIYVWARKAHGLVRFRAVALSFSLYLVKVII